MNLFVFSASPIVNGTLLVLMLFSIVSWSIALIKLHQQWCDERDNKAFASAFWSAKTWQEAADISANMSGKQALLAQAGFAELRGAHRQDMRHLGSPHDGLERSLRQALQNLHRQLESGLTTLASIGSTAPFVGLFGTVWGIMHALQVISKSGSAGLDVVAGPIGEALIATAIGIATALPAVLAYNYHLRRTRIAVLELENFAQDFMHLAGKHDYQMQESSQRE